VRVEIGRRVFDQFFNPTFRSWWKTCTNNWERRLPRRLWHRACAECDPDRLGRIIAESLANLDRFLEGFTPDGGCTEGPGYWLFGFGWYVDLASALYDFTGGAINMMAGERIRKISRYPLTAWIRPGQNLPFADTGHSYLSPHLAIKINRFHAIPELFGPVSAD